MLNIFVLFSHFHQDERFFLISEIYCTVVLRLSKPNYIAPKFVKNQRIKQYAVISYGVSCQDVIVGKFCPRMLPPCHDCFYFEFQVNAMFGGQVI